MKKDELKSVFDDLKSSENSSENLKENSSLKENLSQSEQEAKKSLKENSQENKALKKEIERLNEKIEYLNTTIKELMSDCKLLDGKNKVLEEKANFKLVGLRGFEFLGEKYVLKDSLGRVYELEYKDKFLIDDGDMAGYLSYKKTLFREIKLKD